jgi:hypothetical protein
MKRINLITILFFSLVSFGQTPMNKVVFYDSIGKETFSKEYSFKEIIKEYNIVKAIYEVEYFQKNQDKFILKSRYFVNDKKKLTRHGACIYYFETGKTREIKDYENGQPIKSKSWHENGNIESEKKYFYDDKEARYNYLTENYWDENNNHTVINGNGILEEILRENDTIIFTGKIKNGLKDGIWKTKSSDYPKFEELYEDGVFKNGIIYKSSTKIRKYNSKLSNANPIGGFQEFRKKIAQNIKKSGLTSSYKGNLVFKFTVDENGELVDFSKVEGIHEELYLKLIEIIKNTAKWESGIYKGLEVKSKFTLPITLN